MCEFDRTGEARREDEQRRLRMMRGAGLDAAATFRRGRSPSDGDDDEGFANSDPAVETLIELVSVAGGGAVAQLRARLATMRAELLGPELEHDALAQMLVERITHAWIRLRLFEVAEAQLIAEGQPVEARVSRLPRLAAAERSHLAAVDAFRDYRKSLTQPQKTGAGKVAKAATSVAKEKKLAGVLTAAMAPAAPVNKPGPTASSPATVVTPCRRDQRTGSKPAKPNFRSADAEE